MKRPAKLLLAACLAMIVAGTGPEVIAAAEGGKVVQDLVKVRDSDVIRAALWTRQPDSYALQVVLDRARYDAKRKATAAVNKEQRAANEERVVATQEPVVATQVQGTPVDRGQYFIGNTIANLRGTDPWFPCGRTPTLIDGRRVVGQRQPGPMSAQMVQPNASKAKESRIEVWLLKADGTQILPAAYRCDSDPGAVDVTYGFSIADGEQAVAAAIRVVDDYYIEKLQPLQPRPATAQ